MLIDTVEPPRYRDVIEGDAGILLALIDNASTEALAAAHLVADRLLLAAEPTGAGLQWRTLGGDPHITPGFSHGTAGVAFALATAAAPLDRPDLLAAAVRGAEDLIALSGSANGRVCAVPLIVPPQAHRPAVYFGWCHGPTGTVRLFLLLNAIDPRPRWSAAIDACLVALRESRLPERIEFPDGVAWSNTEHTASVPELPPEPGFMQGAAGIAPFLARLALAPGDIAERNPDWV